MENNYHSPFLFLYRFYIRNICLYCCVRRSISLRNHLSYAAALFLLRFQQVVASDVVLEFFVDLFSGQPKVFRLVVVQDA